MIRNSLASLSAFRLLRKSQNRNAVTIACIYLTVGMARERPLLSVRIQLIPDHQEI